MPKRHTLHMPSGHMFVMRHPKSRQNLAFNAWDNGDDSHFTQEFLATPPGAHHLCEEGAVQAKKAARFVHTELVPKYAFARARVSPMVRARRLAEHITLPNTKWLTDENLREMDYGTLIKIHPRTWYEHDAAYYKARNTCAWSARFNGGESYEVLAAERLTPFFEGYAFTFHPARATFIITHSHVMETILAIHHRWDRETFHTWVSGSENAGTRIGFCEIHHYSHVSPKTGEYNKHCLWFRRIHPLRMYGQYEEWKQIQ